MTKNNILFFGTIAILSLVIMLKTASNLTGQQINEEIMFPDFELPAEEQQQEQLPYTLQQESIQQEETIPKPDADPACLQKCDTGFSLCQHRAQGEDKKIRKCYGSQEGCYTKCEENAGHK